MDDGEKRRAWTCYLGFSTIFTGLTTNLFASVDTAKAHASVGMREQAAVLSCKCLLEWLIREDIEKAGCSIWAQSYSISLIRPKL